VAEADRALAEVHGSELAVNEPSLVRMGQHKMVTTCQASANEIQSARPDALQQLDVLQEQPTNQPIRFSWLSAPEPQRGRKRGLCPI
jgi:hypothetical protein